MNKGKKTDMNTFISRIAAYLDGEPFDPLIKPKESTYGTTLEYTEDEDDSLFLQPDYQKRIVNSVRLRVNAHDNSLMKTTYPFRKWSRLWRDQDNLVRRSILNNHMHKSHRNKLVRRGRSSSLRIQLEQYDSQENTIDTTSQLSIVVSSEQSRNPSQGKFRQLITKTSKITCSLLL